MLNSPAVTKKFGLAPLSDHLHSRVINNSLMTGTSFCYVCFSHDCMCNLCMRVEDSRLILARGFAKNGRGMRATGKEPVFDTDSIDSRAVVNRLAAALAQRGATFFYTHTVNQCDHFGLRRLKEWIDSDEAIEKWCAHYGVETWKDRSEIRKSLVSSSSVLMLRQWMEVSEIWMEYIARSREQPLGEVIRIWWRHEYQDSKGNLSHIHSLIWTKDDPNTEEGCKAAREYIQGSVREMNHEEIVQRLYEEGLLAEDGGVSREDYLYAASTRLKHTCNQKCQRMDKSGVPKCRVKNGTRESPEPNKDCLAEVPLTHSQDSEFVLQEVGVFDNEGKPLHGILKAQRHYAASFPDEGVISECNARLFAATLSNMNIQLCTGYSTSRYIAKYVAGIDEHNKIHVSVDKNETNSLQMKMELLMNTKVGGSRIFENKKAKQRGDQSKPKGRAIALMETIALTLGYPQVYTDINLRRYPCVPLKNDHVLKPR